MKLYYGFIMQCGFADDCLYTYMFCAYYFSIGKNNTRSLRK